MTEVLAVLDLSHFFKACNQSILKEYVILQRNDCEGNAIPVEIKKIWDYIWRGFPESMAFS